MAARYEDRARRLHRPIPHDADDTTPVDTSEHPLLNYHKRIIAIHNVLWEAGTLPSFDPIRRVAEEVDAQFARGTPPPGTPPALAASGRPPSYYERRVLAMEAWLLERGLLTPEEHAWILEQAQAAGPHRC